MWRRTRWTSSRPTSPRWKPFAVRSRCRSTCALPCHEHFLTRARMRCACAQGLEALKMERPPHGMLVDTTRRREPGASAASTEPTRGSGRQQKSRAQQSSMKP